MRNTRDQCEITRDARDRTMNTPTVPKYAKMKNVTVRGMNARKQRIYAKGR